MPSNMSGQFRRPNSGYLFIKEILDYEWQINDLPSLEEAEIDVAMYSTHRDFIKLMTGLDHTKKLELATPVNCFAPHSLVSLLVWCQHNTEDYL